MIFFFSLLLFCHSSLQIKSPKLEIDENGYILYCPCMGRFGNQMDHLLGSLAFARKLNRTLVVPPFIQYDHRHGNRYVHYSDWFKLDELSRFHRVVEMREFVNSGVWDSKVVYCHEVAMRRSESGECPAKEGNPFGPFWDNFNVTFGQSKSHRLNFNGAADQWESRFPKWTNRVMAFMGAPAPYPVTRENRGIQKHVEWNEIIQSQRDEIIRTKLIGSYLAVHLRNGADWLRACDHVTDEGINYPFMSSPQCVSPHKKGKTLFTKKMCFPPRSVVLNQVLKVVMATKVKHLYVATDNDPMRQNFEDLFRSNNLDCDVITSPQDSVETDLAVMEAADWFVGNCASSITAMVARKRLVEGRPTGFFAVEGNSRHSEL